MKSRAWLAQWVALLPAAVVMGGGWLSGCEAQEKSGSKFEKTSIYFTDSRDGRKYRAVKVGAKTWMAENMNYQDGNSWCYGDDSSGCGKYGRLYDWNTAKWRACPSGWHLPSRQEWNSLVTAAGGGIAGRKLKAASGWNENGNGTDDFGFSALPGGSRSHVNGSFGNAGDNGFWWTATESGSVFNYLRGINCQNDDVFEDDDYKKGGFSVRCVRD